MEDKKEQAGNSTSPDSYRDDTPKVTGIGGIDTVGNKIELWEPS